MSAAPRDEAILLLGGRSGIGRAIVVELLDEARAAGRAPVVLLAQRPGGADVGLDLMAAGAGGVELVGFDALALEDHEGLLAGVFERYRVSHAVVAFGVLGDQEEAWQQVSAAQRLMTVNAAAAVGCGVALGQLMAAQQPDVHGCRGSIVAISSVAGTRVRRANFVYGASKQAMDSFFLRLADVLSPRGVRVLVVRPGAVATAMIAGKPQVPLTVPPERVAVATRRALGNPAITVIHVPGLFAPVMALARILPERVWKLLKS